MQMFLSDSFFDDDPFTWNKSKKNSIFIKCFNKLNQYHYKNCGKYKNILDALNLSKNSDNKLDSFPYLPVNIFKENEYITGSKKIYLKLYTPQEQLEVILQKYF